MSEAREVAVNMLAGYRAHLGSFRAVSSLEHAERYVHMRMRNETQQVKDNVIWELHQLAKAGPTTPCPTLCTCRPYRGLACKRHWDPINEVSKEGRKQ